MTTKRRYHYLINAMLLLGGDTPAAFIPQKLYLGLPIRSMDDIEIVKEGLVNDLGRRNPHWDRQFRGWRDMVAILGFSLFQVEVEQRGRWVLADWQPWGPLNPQ